jgi:hypothetical protein
MPARSGQLRSGDIMKMGTIREPIFMETHHRRSGSPSRHKETGTPVLVRLQPAELAALDTWIETHTAFHLPSGRPEAIRCLVSTALKEIADVNARRESSSS